MPKPNYLPLTFRLVNQIQLDVGKWSRDDHYLIKTADEEEDRRILEVEKFLESLTPLDLKIVLMGEQSTTEPILDKYRTLNPVLEGSFVWFMAGIFEGEIVVE